MLYMKDWEVCAPPGFSLGFEGDNGVTVLEVSTDLTEEWDLKVDVEKDGGKNIIQLTRNGTVYSALLTASMLADDGTHAGTRYSGRLCSAQQPVLRYGVPEHQCGRLFPASFTLRV